jgi:hypothetical protein
MTTETETPIQVEQPKPLFNLDDLDQKLTSIYQALLAKNQDGITDPDTTTARSVTQELLAIVTKYKNDLQPIDVAGKAYEVEVSKALDNQKVQFTVCGVQLWQDRKLAGTSLYSTVVKARKIRDICNAEYARLGVNHEAKIVNYPVF